MSSVHARSSLVRLSISLRGADFWRCVSPAKVDNLQNGWQWCQRDVWCTGQRERAPAPSPEAHHPWAALVARINNHWSELTDWIPKRGQRRESRIWWSITSKAAERSNSRRTKRLSLSRAERMSFTTRNKTCTIGWLKGVAGVVCLKMGEKFVKNYFFKKLGQKWKVRDGAVVFQKILVKWWLFQQGFYNCSIQIMWYNYSSKRFQILFNCFVLYCSAALNCIVQLL